MSARNTRTPRSLPWKPTPSSSNAASYVAETQAAVQAVGDAKVRFINTEGWITEATDTVDNVHPNDTGHQKIADRLAPLVRLVSA